MEYSEGTHNVLFIGVGNRYRSDDGVGLYIAEELRKKEIPGLEVMIMRDDGYSLVEAWAGHPLVIVADAADSGGEVGTIRRIEALDAGLPTDLSPVSSHSISLAEALTLGRTLKRLPEQLLVYAIEANHFAHGTTMAKAVKRAADRVISDILTLEPLRSGHNHV